MKVTRINIELNQLHSDHKSEVIDMADDAESLDPQWIAYEPVVRQSSKGLVIVDGFSRMAGMVAFGSESFPVLLVEGADEMCREIDCDSVIGECPELDSIYAEVA